MVKKTISDIPKEASIPFKDAYATISGEVLKKSMAMMAVTTQPIMLISVPDSRRNTRPINITIMGIIARINRASLSNQIYHPFKTEVNAFFQPRYHYYKCSWMSALPLIIL